MKYIRSLRLKSGELLAATLEADFSILDFENLRYITLHNPILYNSFKFLDPHTDQVVDTISMSPYNALTNDKAVIIQTSRIESINTLREGAAKRYNAFVSNLDQYNRAGDEILNQQSEPVQAESESESDVMDSILRDLPDTKFFH
jgi:hypothetical protein